MPAEVKGSHKLFLAIGDRIRLVARATGRNETYVSHWLNPQPSKEHPRDDGEANPVDILCGVLDNIEDAEPFLAFVCRRYGFKAVPESHVQKHLAYSPGDLAELAERLAKELRRHKPSAEALRSLRDELADAAAHLVTEKEEKR